MAEEPIRKDDIMDFEGTKAAFNDLIATVEKLSTVLHKDLKTSADEWLKSLNGINIATKEGQEVLNNAAAATGTLVAQEKELTKLDKDKTQLQARLNALSSEQASVNARLRVEIEKKNRANKEDAKLMDAANGSINKMRSDIKRLVDEYNNLDKAGRMKAAGAINKLNKELDQAEKIIGRNTRNVGNYKNAMMEAGREVLGFIGIAGGLTAVLGQVKDAFLETETGTKVVGKWKQAFKTAMQGIVGGENPAMIGAKIKASFELAKQADELRKGDRQDLVDLAKMETELSLLRYKAADATLSEAEQTDYLIQAQKKEDQIINFKIKDKQDDLDLTRQLLAVRTEDTALLDKAAQLEAEIESIKGDKNLRIQTRLTGLREKEIKKAKEQAEADQKLAQIQMDGANGLTISKLHSNAKLDMELDKSKRNQLKGNEEFYEQQQKLAEKYFKEEVEANLQKEEEKRMAIQESLSFMSGTLTTFGNLYESQKQRELSAAGDNAVKREEIERKYAKKQQALSVGQALINGAMAITEIWKKWAANPVLAGVFTALASAQTIAQVAVIKSQKFARGGSGVLGGNVHASGGVQIPGIGEAERGEHFSIINRGATNKYGSSMLDAVSSSINQGKFFEVWSNANKSMGAGDPYTKKMFDLMAKTPVVYADSEGNTVKDYVALGKKQVIKKKSRRKVYA